MPEIIYGNQGEDAWFQHRLCSLGASSMARVLANGKGRQDLLEQYALEARTGEKTETYASQDMKDGIEAEPFIRKEYELVTGNKIETVALVKSDIPGLHVSPDGLSDTKDGKGGLEIKKRIRKIQFSYVVARKDGWKDEWRDSKKQERLTQGIPSNPEYIQVQTSLLVTKRVWWDYCSAVVIFKEDPYTGEKKMCFDYALGNDWIIIQRVYRDESFIKTIKDETIKFLAELKMLIRKME